MADETSWRSWIGDWAGTLQIMLGVLTAAFGAYITVQQNDIKHRQDEIKTRQDDLALRIQMKAQTETFADRTLAYVKDNLTITDVKQKEAIVIDLLDAIALANVSERGVTDQEKLLHMPLWIALATGNVDALGLIGNDDDRRKVWLGLAETSGAATVRQTAMEALARSSASRPMEHLVKIFDLSEHLNNEDVLDHAIQQIARVVRVMERHASPAQFRDDPRVTPVIARLTTLQTSLSASAGVAAAEPLTPQRLADLKRQTDGVALALAFLRGSDDTPLPAPSPLPGVPPAPVESVSTIVQQLKSKDPSVVREARQTVAQLSGRDATDSLLDELAADPGNYGLRLAISSMLYESTRPLVVTDAKRVRAIGALLGDDDVLIRKYASEGLMKLTDSATVDQFHTELVELIRSRDRVPENAVYNAVVVLGTWLRILPPSLQSRKPVIAGELSALQDDLRDEPKWTNTTAAIGEMLRLSARGPQQQAAAGDGNGPQPRHD